MNDEDEIVTSISPTNVGERQGAEVLQVYIRHVNPATSRPEEESKDFQITDLRLLRFARSVSGLPRSTLAVALTRGVASG